MAEFGTALAISPDRIFVGSPNHSMSNEPGSVRVYDRATGLLIDTIEAPEFSTGGFGASLALSGTRRAVGAPYGNPGGGSVYEYDATTLALTRTIPTPHACTRTYFGAAVAFAGDDLIVGARDDGAHVLPGAIYVYDAAGSLRQTILNPPPAFADFGTAIAGVGHSIVAGAYQGNRAYVFTMCGDGMADPGEACDDGNTTSGDGCSASCARETTTTTSTSSSTSTSTRPSPLALVRPHGRAPLLTSASCYVRRNTNHPVVARAGFVRDESSPAAWTFTSPR